MNTFRLYLSAILIALPTLGPHAASAQSYEWYPQSSAPRGYLAEFVYANLLYGRDESIYVPSVGSRHGSWGWAGGLHIVGPERKQIPHRLSLAWMSFNENKFYAGEFDLPVKEIEALFRVQGRNGRGIADQRDRYIIVGVAPHGAVSVWVAAHQGQFLVGSYIAEEIDMSIKQLVPNVELSRYAYVSATVEDYLKRYPEMADMLQSPPPDYWSSIYLAEYVWRPIFDFPNGTVIEAVTIEFFNGETLFVQGDDPLITSYSERAVPRYMRIHWRDGEQHFALHIDFVDLETLRAFQYAAEPAHVGALDFVIAPQIDGNRMQLMLSVGSGDRWAYLVDASFRYRLKD